MQAETRVAWPLPTAELKPALELALALAGADMTVLLLHDETMGVVFPALAHGIDEQQCAMIGSHHLGVDPFGIALTEHRRIVVRDAWRGESTLAALAQKLGFRSIEIVPLFAEGGQMIGEIAIMFRRVRGTSPRMVKLVDHLSRLVVSAVVHAKSRADTERARESAELARENAEQAGHAKSQFLARMSHELRTPLQSIAGYVDLLLVGNAEPLTPSQARLLAHVHDSEQILVHVIDDLITFSRLEAGHVAYHIGAIAAEDALRITQSVVSPLAADHHVVLDVAECRDILVTADGDKLKQILVNLAANAVKFSSKNGTVHIACRATGDNVCFEVSDDGPGIPSDSLREIFEPYVQLGAPTSDPRSGTGLGLTISREFATGMHGELSVASSVGKGSVFTLTLPRASMPQTAGPPV